MQLILLCCLLLVQSCDQHVDGTVWDQVQECSCEHLPVMLSWEGAGTNPRLHGDTRASMRNQQASARLPL